MPTQTILPNPYSTKPVNPLSKPLYSPLPKPTTTTVGNVSVNTSKPVIFTTPQGSTPITGDVVEPVKEEKKGFWASKTKKQKTLIIGGVAVVAIIAVLAMRKK
jgi:hypothetical protein